MGVRLVIRKKKFLHGKVYQALKKELDAWEVTEALFLPAQYTGSIFLIFKNVDVALKHMG